MDMADGKDANYTVKNGQSELIMEYRGDCHENRAHGQGIYTWEDGRKYIGGWMDGKHHGEGVYITS